MKHKLASPSGKRVEEIIRLVLYIFICFSALSLLVDADSTLSDLPGGQFTVVVWSLLTLTGCLSVVLSIVVKLLELEAAALLLVGTCVATYGLASLSLVGFDYPHVSSLSIMVLSLSLSILGAYVRVTRIIKREKPIDVLEGRRRLV